MNNVAYRAAGLPSRFAAPLLAIAAFCALAVALVAPPLAFALLFSALAMMTRRTGLHTLWLFLACQSIFLTLNLSKVPDNDWGWYSSHYYWLRHLPFDQYIGTRFGQFNIKITEPVYYFMASMLSKLSDGNLAVLVTAVTAIVYLPVCLIASYFTKHLEDKPFVRLLVEWTVLLAGLSFTLTLHLIRQQVGGAILFMGVFLALRGHLRWAILFVLLSVFAHNSVGLPLALFTAVLVLSRWLSGKKLIVLSAGVGVLLGFAVLFLSIVLHYYSDGRSDGEISALTLFFDIFLLTAFVWTGRSQGVLNGKTGNVLTAFVVGYFAFLFILLPLPIPFLRMYFFMEYVRVILLVVLLGRVARPRQAVLFVPLLLAVALALFSARLIRSPFVFGAGAFIEVFHPPWAPVFENPLRQRFLPKVVDWGTGK